MKILKFFKCSKYLDYNRLLAVVETKIFFKKVLFIKRTVLKECFETPSWSIIKESPKYLCIIPVT